MTLNSSIFFLGGHSQYPIFFVLESFNVIKLWLSRLCWSNSFPGGVHGILVESLPIWFGGRCRKQTDLLWDQQPSWFVQSVDSRSTCSHTHSLNHALYPVWISGLPYPNDPLKRCTLPNPHPAGSFNTESALSSFLRIHTHYFVLWALRSPVPCHKLGHHPQIPAPSNLFSLASAHH